jgi:two-component system nitrate/nitrite response regulator NarP
MITILIADDHPMIAHAIEMLLRGSRYSLTGRAQTGADALAQVKRLDPDLVLLDVHMPDGTGIDVLRQLREKGKRRVVLLTADIDDQLLLAADSLEADGLVLKTADPALWLDCLDHVLSGRRWIDPEIGERLKQLKERASDLTALAPRERRLVALVRRGLKNREIAAELGVTEGTVKVYLHTLFEKLGVSNRTELAMRAPEFLSPANLDG